MSGCSFVMEETMNPIELEIWKPKEDDPVKKEYAGQRTAQEVLGERPLQAGEFFRYLTSSEHDAWMAEELLRKGMVIEPDNYAALEMCIRKGAMDCAKLIVEQGMDLDGYDEEGNAVTIEETYTVAIPNSLAASYALLSAELGRDITDEDMKNINQIYTRIAATVTGTIDTIPEKPGIAVWHNGHIGVTVESNDLWGNRTILSLVGEGGFFAETYALLKNEVMLVDAVASEDNEILFLQTGLLNTLNAAKHIWLPKLTSNLLTISAHKNLTLSGRSFHTAPKSARGRIMAYLNTVALQKRSSEFDIPFDRQQMADYLNLDRSALSKELGKMRREGIIA